MALVRCPDCGANISDQAPACPFCGRPMRIVPAYPVQRDNGFTSVYPQIRAFSDGVKSIYTLSILAFILSMGIGIIFALINIPKIKNLPQIDSSQITSPVELAEYQAAERKLKTARILSSATLIIFGVLLFVGIIAGAIAAQT